MRALLLVLLLVAAAQSELVRFTLVAQEAFSAPDGFVRLVRTFNGSVPGPVLRARVGDTLQVTVLNFLPDATSVHWHGVDQRDLSVYSDGVPMLTQYPIPPGGSFVYFFSLLNEGTMWYHSHSGTQRVDGMAGALIIEEKKGEKNPYSDDYESEAIIFLSDWYREWSDDLFNLMVGKDRIFPTEITAITFNGKAQSNCSGIDPKKCDPNRPLDIIQMPASGKRIRLRIISGTANSLLRFAIDGHK